MSNKISKTVVKYKPLSAENDSAFKTERSLDTITFPGSYLVEIIHNGSKVGLPVDDCGEEHYIVGTLVVTDSGTSGLKQMNRVIGQVLTITSRESKDTKLYTRTMADGEWGIWRSLANSGMYDEISVTDELLSTVSELVSDASRSVLVETLLKYRDVNIEYTGTEANSVLKDALKLLRVETNNPDVNAVGFRVTLLFKNHTQFGTRFALKISSGEELLIIGDDILDGNVHSKEFTLTINETAYKYTVFFAVDGNVVDSDGIIINTSYAASPYNVSIRAVVYIDDTIVPSLQSEIKNAVSSLQSEINNTEIASSFIQIADATDKQTSYHSIVKNVQIALKDIENTTIDLSSIALSFIRKRSTGVELWWSAIVNGSRTYILRDNITPIENLNSKGYTHFEFSRSAYEISISYDADFNKVAIGTSEFVYGSLTAEPSFVVSGSNIHNRITPIPDIDGKYRENINGGQIASFVPDAFGIAMQNDPTMFDIKTPYLITESSVFSIFLEIGDAGERGSQIGGIAIRLNFWLFRDGFSYYPPKAIYGLPVNLPEIPIRLATDSNGYVHIILGEDNVKWTDLGWSSNVFINIDKVYAGRNYVRPEGWSVSNATSIDASYGNVTKVTSLIAPARQTDFLAEVLPLKPASFAVFGSSKSTARSFKESSGWVGKMLNGLLQKAGLVTDFASKNTALGLATNRRYFNNTGRKIAGVGNYIEFETYGNSLAVVQVIARTTDYGTFNVYADDALIGSFNNRNDTVKGRKSITFEGNGTQRSFFIPDLCSYGFSVKVDNVEKSVTMDSSAVGGGAYDCYVARTIMPNSNGEVQRILYFPNAPTGTIDVSYEIGDLIAYAVSDYHTADDGKDENLYPVYISDVNSVATYQSGYPLMPVLCDERAVARFNFASYAKRKIRIEITGGVNPYFDFDFAVAEYNTLMNAAFGGYDVPRVNSEPRWRDWRCVRYFNTPDKLFLEYGTNDDRYEIDRVLVSTKEMSIDKLKQVKMKLVKSIAKAGTSLSVGMCTGTISSIDAFGLSSDDIKSSDIQMGDYVRIGEYHSSWREFVVRRVVSVDKEAGRITWDVPFSTDSIWRYNSLDEMTGAQFAVRRLGQFKDNMRTAISKMKVAVPSAEIYLVGMSAFRDNAYCSGWGYNEALQDLAKELSCKFINIADEQVRYNEAALAEYDEIDVVSTGTSSYTVPMSSFINQNREMRVLVNGIDVTGVSAYVEINKGWHVKDDAAIDDVELTAEQDWNRVTQFASDVDRDVDVVFYKDVPSASDTISLICAKKGWSDDGVHQSANGNITYSNCIIKVF